MASTSSQPQAGPSSRIPGAATSQQFVDTEILDYLLAEEFGDKAGPRLRNMLRENELNIVPLGGSSEDKGQQRPPNRENDSNLEQKLELSEKQLKEMEKKLKRLEERDKRIGGESEGLRWRCAKLEDEQTKVREEMAAEQAKFEKDRVGLIEKIKNSKNQLDSMKEQCLKMKEVETELRLKLNQAENRVKAESEKRERTWKEKADKLLKERDELLNKVTRLEKRSSLLEVEKENLEKRRREEQRKGQTFQENMIKRQQEVVALKDERENWLRERIRFKLFLEKVGSICGYPGANEVDFDLCLQSEELDKLSNHLEKFLEKRGRDRVEVEQQIADAEQAQNLISQLQHVFQRITGSLSSTSSCGTSAVASSRSSLNNERVGHSEVNELDETATPPIAVIVGVASVSKPCAAGTSFQNKQSVPPSPGLDTTGSPKKRPLSSPDQRVQKKRLIFTSSSSKNTDTAHETDAPSTRATAPSPVPVLQAKSIVTTPAPSSITTTTTSFVASTRPWAEVLATPRSETTFNHPVSTSTPVNTGPSIVVTCGPSTAPNSSVVPNPSPAPELSDDPQPELQPPSNQRRSNGYSRLYKQFTPFAETTKEHAINRGRSRHSCICGNVYQNEKGLKVHISKMTKEWKYKCNGCLQYFFYQSDLSRHLKISAKCSVKTKPCSSQDHNTFTNYSEDLLAMPTVQQQQAAAAITSVVVAEKVAHFSTSVSKPAPKKPSNKNNKRKTKQSIFRNKKHRPWSKQTINGSWLCTCGSKFSNKNNLEMHSQYFTRDWQFHCDLCSEKYFFLSYLKKHMGIAHGIHDAFKDYSTGCHICGEMFRRRKDCILHRKLAHQKPRRSTAIPKTSTGQGPSASNPKMHNTYSADKDLDDITIISVVTPSGSTYLPPRTTPMVVSPRVSPSPVLLPPPDTITAAVPRVPPSASSSSNASQKSTEHAMVDRLSEEDTGLFKCLCGKTYLSKTALNHHIKKMTVGNIFVCLKCSRAFQVLANLKTHMKTIHLEDYKGFSCGKCKKRFVNALVFEKHRREEHEEVSEGYDTDMSMD